MLIFQGRVKTLGSSIVASYEITSGLVLGDQKQAALGSRSDIRRGPVTPTHRSWCQKHGGGPPFRAQFGPPRRRQAIKQAPPQARRLEPAIPAGHSRPAAAKAV